MRGNSITATQDTLICAAGSHPGQIRSSNEDLFHCDLERGIFIVIDGIGGHAAGEQAAEITLQMLRARLERPTGSIEERIREAITLANNEVYREAQSNPDWEGMACVLTVVVVEDNLMTAGHVGDTRLYELGPGKIEKITHDHSPVGEREDAGLITEAEAMRHPRRNEVYRDVGSEEHCPDEPDFIQLVRRPFGPGRALLLCSDGLSDLLTSAHILSIVERYAGCPDEIVRQLLKAANDAGGTDNITVIYAARGADATNALTTEGEREGHQLIVRADEFVAHPHELSAADEHARSTNYPGRLFSNRWSLLAYGVLVSSAVFAFLLWQVRWPPHALLRVDSNQQPRKLIVNAQDPDSFKSINDALAQARQGDVVEVAPGRYIESVLLREGVSVISTQFRQAVIQAPNWMSQGEKIAVTASGISNGRFIGFRLEGDDRYPLDVGLHVRGAGLEVSDLEIKGTQVAGIEIDGAAADTVLRANLIQDNFGVGMLIHGEASPRLIHNLILHNGDRTKSYGLKVSENARPQFIGNTIIENGRPGIAGLEPEREAEIIKQNILPEKPLKSFDASAKQ